MTTYQNSMMKPPLPTTFAPGVERLRTLYAVLFGVPAEKVDLSSWREGTYPYPGESTMDKSLTDPGCGTTGCAVGWACAYPPFQDQGLCWYGNLPRYRDEENSFMHWQAVEQFFGLSPKQAYRMFSGSALGVNAKKLVLRRIRKYLLNKRAITPKRSAELAFQEQALTL